MSAAIACARATAVVEAHAVEVAHHLHAALAVGARDRGGRGALLDASRRCAGRRARRCARAPRGRRSPRASRGPGAPCAGGCRGAARRRGTSPTSRPPIIDCTISATVAASMPSAAAFSRSGTTRASGRPEPQALVEVDHAAARLRGGRSARSRTGRTPRGSRCPSISTSKSRLRRTHRVHDRDLLSRDLRQRLARRAHDLLRAAIALIERDQPHVDHALVGAGHPHHVRADAAEHGGRLGLLEQPLLVLGEDRLGRLERGARRRAELDQDEARVGDGKELAR